jgi:C1A family cysteine protease
MKKILIIALTGALFYSCHKSDASNEHRTFGALGKIPDNVPILRSSRKKPRPVKPPADSTPAPVDTTVYVPPATVYPAQYSLVTPMPLQQGSEGSCVSFSTCYAREMEQYRLTGSKVILSEEYLFNQTTNDHQNCSGSAIITAFDFLKVKGVCTYASMPYMWTNGCNTMPTPAQDQEALQYRITSYYQVPVSDTDAVKALLMQGKPLTSHYAVDNDFCNAGSSFVWRSLGPVVNYHSLVVVGWDDAKRAYKVINSWGVGWGDGGFGWIAYDLMPKVSSNLIVMTL